MAGGAETKEHVIGRRFVPKGKFDGHWNLILNACGPCNNRKADLEDDTSAITLQPALDGQHPGYDEATLDEARRKSEGAFSRRTKRAVKNSQETLNLRYPLGTQSNINFTLASPAQLDTRRAFELARLQLAAFFFFITYNEDEKRGYFWTGGYHPVMLARRSDWGNSVFMDFADAVLLWEPRFVGHTAAGHFSVCIRRHPNTECWSWAVEWNASTRMIGFFGDRTAAETIVSGFRGLEYEHHDTGGESWVRIRAEVPLVEEMDRLFDVSNWQQEDGR